MGVLERHGDHAAVGLDGIRAHAVCVAAAQRSGGVVAPTVWGGTDKSKELADGTYLTGGIERGERYDVPGSVFCWCGGERPQTHTSASTPP